MKCASTAPKFQWPCEVAKPGQAERAPVAQAKPRLLKERSPDGIGPHVTDARASRRKNFDADDACQQASERRARGSRRRRPNSAAAGRPKRLRRLGGNARDQRARARRL